MDTQNNAQKEAQQVIEEMRAKRAALGDTTNTKVKFHYRRLQRPKVAAFVWNFYIFLAGMLFSAMMHGDNVLWILVLVVILIGVTYLRE